MSVGKTVRFEVFRRDGFTCRYCGSKPPDVVLEIDHVLPRRDGGGDEPLNLVTSCFACNRGKAGRQIKDPVQKPDADFETLAVEQEIGEIRQYQRRLAAREEAQKELIRDLQDAWVSASGLDWSPHERIVKQFLGRYEPTIIEAAILAVAPKVADRRFRGKDDWLKYLWGTMRNMEKRRKNGG